MWKFEVKIDGSLFFTKKPGLPLSHLKQTAVKPDSGLNTFDKNGCDTHHI